MDGEATGIQALILIVGGLFLLWQIFLGWRRGPLRQVCAVLAIIAGYVAGVYGGSVLAPLLQPLLPLPGFLVSVAGGILMALAVYFAVGLAGSILFRKTGDQESGVVRFVYGVSGGLLGCVAGLLLLWILFMGFRLAGTVAVARLESALLAGKEEELPPVVGIMARFRQATETGRIGEAARRVDAVPERTHRLVGGAVTVMTTPARARLFLEFPPARELADDPAFTRLGSDPDVQEALRKGDYAALFRHPGVAALFNDPDMAERLKKFDLGGAIEYALDGEIETSDTTRP